MGRQMDEVPLSEDPSGWIVDNPVADFLRLTSPELMYMAFFGYTFFHGIKVFNKIAPDAAPSYKFVTLSLACTGGGTLVPIFLNSIPVFLDNDAYAFAILASFAVHHYFGVIREVYALSSLVKFMFVVLYETMRAKIVVKFTTMAAARIAPSLFSSSVCGPIVCGAIAGCGGAFFPLNKGLDPIKKGLAPNMLSAFIAATAFHLFLVTPWSDGCIKATEKAHVHVSCFFIAVGLSDAFSLGVKSVIEAPKLKTQ